MPLDGENDLRAGCGNGKGKERASESRDSLPSSAHRVLREAVLMPVQGGDWSTGTFLDG